MKAFSLIRTTVVLACVAMLLLTSCGGLGASQSSATPTVMPTVTMSTAIVAEGRVLPLQFARLSFALAGRMAEIAVREGDTVSAGQLLVRLDDAQARAAVAEAEAALATAEAQLAELEAGADAQEIAAAEAAVAAAQATVNATQGAVSTAHANLARLRAGATVEERAIAQQQVEAARNALWGLQAQRDSVCGMSAGAACDAAKAAVQQAEDQVRIAQLQMEQVNKGATAEEIQAAEGQVLQAQGQADAARASLAQARASLAQLKNGASDEAIRAAEAQVARARAGMDQARAALAETELRAPFAGQVAAVDARLGERVVPGAPVVQVADVSAWEIETEDLTEIEVVQITEGETVTVEPDALPGVQLEGTIESIDAASTVTRGDVTYTVRIRLRQADPRLRWGMTVQVTFR